MISCRHRCFYLRIHGVCNDSGYLFSRTRKTSGGSLLGECLFRMTHCRKELRCEGILKGTALYPASSYIRQVHIRQGCANLCLLMGNPKIAKSWLQSREMREHGTRSRIINIEKSSSLSAETQGVQRANRSSLDPAAADEIDHLPVTQEWVPA